MRLLWGKVVGKRTEESSRGLGTLSLQIWACWLHVCSVCESLSSCERRALNMMHGERVLRGWNGGDLRILSQGRH